MRETRRPVVDRLPDVLSVLLGPTLPQRPACAGLSPLFDLDVGSESRTQRAERHDLAVSMCRSCPALTACAAAAAELDGQYLGVWAGTVRGQTPRSS